MAPLNAHAPLHLLNADVIIAVNDVIASKVTQVLQPIMHEHMQRGEGEAILKTDKAASKLTFL